MTSSLTIVFMFWNQTQVQRSVTKSATLNFTQKVKSENLVLKNLWLNLNKPICVEKRRVIPIVWTQRMKWGLSKRSEGTTVRMRLIMDPSSNLFVLLRRKNKKTKKLLTRMRSRPRNPKLVKIKFKTFWMKLWMVKARKYKWQNHRDQVSRKIKNSMVVIKELLMSLMKITMRSQHLYNKKNQRQMLQVIL